MPRTLIDEEIPVEQIRPTHDHVLVKIINREKTGGGLYLPKNTATPCVVGKVIAIGTGIPNNHNGQDFPIKLKVGEYVLFMDYAGERMRCGWEDYRLIREHGLWATVKMSDFDAYEFEEVKPWADRIVITPDDETKTRSGLLFLPNKDMPIKYRGGTVHTTGFGVWHLESGNLLPCQTKPGDRILFERYAGAEIRLRGKDYRIIQEIDVLGILEDEGHI